MNQLINDEAVYRTAPATPGVLKTFCALYYVLVYGKLHVLSPESQDIRCSLSSLSPNGKYVQCAKLGRAHYRALTGCGTNCQGVSLPLYCNSGLTICNLFMRYCLEGGGGGTNYHQIAKRLVSNFAWYILAP